MKILHITATHLNKCGGIPVVLENLVRYQNKLDGIKSIVLSVKYDVKNMNSSYFYFRNQQNQIEEFIFEYNPDITIIHDVYCIEYVSISKFLYKNKYKYYIEPHSCFMRRAQRKGYFKKFIANKTLFRDFIRNSCGYIYLNNSEISNSIYRTNNDLIIPNGIEKKELMLEKKSNEKIKIFYMGRIDIIHKGLDLLLLDLKKIDDKKRDIVIHLYGTGRNKDLKKINSMIKSFKNLEIEFKGPVYDIEKERVMQNYNIMILTSRYEGFPMSVLEALSFGNPCIVSDGTNVRDIIENNKLGWGTEYHKISDTILYAVEDYKLNQQFYINTTISFVNENFNWLNIAKQSVKLLENC